MTSPKDLKYTKTHEWAKIDGETATIGITQFAVSQINEVIFLELFQKGKVVSANQPFGSIESVKAVFDLNSPVNGTVVETNQPAVEKPELIAQDPYGAGWMVKVQLTGANTLDHLMDAAAYDVFIASEAAHH